MQELTKDTYFECIKKGAVIVKIGADWCPDCKRIEPIMEALQNEYKDTIQFFSVNFSNEEELKDTLNIRRIPTLIFYKDGNEVGERLIEPSNRAMIEEALQQIV